MADRQAILAAFSDPTRQAVLNLLRRRATVSAEEAKRGRKSDWLFVGLIVATIVALLFGSIMLTIFVWWYVATHLQVM